MVQVKCYWFHSKIFIFDHVMAKKWFKCSDCGISPIITALSYVTYFSHFWENWADILWELRRLLFIDWW